jgi:DNA polymerase-3 subunit epsilon
MREDAGSAAPQGVLLRRAHEFLKKAGQPVPESVLIQHLYGANVQDDYNKRNLWTMLLRQLLRSSALFEFAEAASTWEQPDSAEAQAIVETLEHGGSIEITGDLTEKDVEEAPKSAWFAGERSWSLVAWRNTQRLLDEIDFVVLDTETTGTRPGPDRVIEVAGVRLRGGQTIGSFQSLLNPGRSLPSFIVQFTGIRSDMLAKAPTAREVMPDFLNFIAGSILVGHNISFDLGFLANEAQLLDESFPLEGLDTIMLARRFVPGLSRFKLDVVATHLGISVRDRHRAMGDASVTAEVFLQILERAKEQGIQTLGHLHRRLQLPVAWQGDITKPSRKKSEVVLADGRVGAKTYAIPRPNGSLFLDAAWKRDFPTLPGVYLMKDANGQVIYVGKAKNLKERLASYYHQPLGQTRKMDGLLPSVKEIETRVLNSELEALLVESQLIKQLQPAYNVLLRNYDEYPFIKIDVQNTFPRVYSTYEVEADGARYFGPFRSRKLVEITLELIQKMFPIRTCERDLPPLGKSSEPCLRHYMKRCSGPCAGGADAESYRQMIEEVCAFLGGERADLQERLKQQMFAAAENLQFERAALMRDMLRSLDEILIGQRLMTGAIEANNLLIIYPAVKEEHNELFLIRHGRLIRQQTVAHEQEIMQGVVLELLRQARTLGEPPAIVGKAEVDQITIIGRWIQRHSDDFGRAFFPFQSALVGEEALASFALHLWQEADENRRLLLQTSR